jgi:hypothetical protein
MCLAEFFFVEEFGHRAHEPFGRSFENQVSKDVCPLIACKFGGDVQMSGPPVPPLRYDSVNAGAETAVPAAVRQQSTELRGDARAELILKRARANNVLEKRSRR